VTITASIQMWADNSSQACTASLFPTVESYSSSDQEALQYSGLGLNLGPDAAKPNLLCTDQNTFLGNGGQLGIGVTNVARLATEPSVLAQELETAKTGSPALDQSFTQDAPIDEPSGGPKYDKAFERAVLLLIGPTSGATPALSVALLKALPKIPGVEPIGVVRAHSGQSGVGFSGTTLAGTTTVVLDPHTGVLIEARNPDDAAFRNTDRVDIRWLDPIRHPTIVARASVPSRVLFGLGLPPNREVDVTFKSTAGQFPLSSPVIRGLLRGLPSLSSSGGSSPEGTKAQIDFRGTLRQQHALAVKLEKSGLFSSVTERP
jgi:hypothetical protein